MKEVIAEDVKKEAESVEEVREEAGNELTGGRTLWKRRDLWLLAWPLALIMYLMARCNSTIAEYVFAKGLFRVYSNVLSFITAILPFSLGEILLFAVPAAVVAMIAAGIIRVVRSRGTRLWQAARLGLNILTVTGVILCWYMLGCGVNYYRYEFTEYSGYEVRKSSTEELYELCVDLAIKTNEAGTAARQAARLAGYAQAQDEQSAGTITSKDTLLADGAASQEEMSAEPSVFTSYMTNQERSKAAADAMRRLSEKYAVLRGYYPRPKPVLLSRGMSYMGITGVYFPWTVEANVNVDTPDYSKAVTACHELSHLRGFMREDEANFIGYLACVNSDEPELVYSGYMLALIHAGNRLYAENAELYYQVAATYDDGVVADFIANNEYWKQFEDTVANEVGEKMNDTYLKANNQTDGTKSYGRMVDLLLAEWRSQR